MRTAEDELRALTERLGAARSMVKSYQRMGRDVLKYLTDLEERLAAALDALDAQPEEAQRNEPDQQHEAHAAHLAAA
jgi:hypothetical protein